MKSLCAALLSIALVVAVSPSKGQGPVDPVLSSTTPTIFQGAAVAVAGDTLDLTISTPHAMAGQTVTLMLAGIQAPLERTPDGDASRTALDRLIFGREVSCRLLDGDTERAFCSTEGEDLGESQIAGGQAVPLIRWIHGDHETVERYLNAVPILMPSADDHRPPFGDTPIVTAFLTILGGAGAAVLGAWTTNRANRKQHAQTINMSLEQHRQTMEEAQKQHAQTMEEVRQQHAQTLEEAQNRHELMMKAEAERIKRSELSQRREAARRTLPWFIRSMHEHKRVRDAIRESDAPSRRSNLSGVWPFPEFKGLFPNVADVASDYKICLGIVNVRQKFERLDEALDNYLDRGVSEHRAGYLQASDKLLEAQRMYIEDVKSLIDDEFNTDDLGIDLR